MTSAPARPAVLVAGNLARAGFSHGFATREGGVSEGAFASLNFGAGDEPARVGENVRRFAAAVGFAPEGLRQVTQVHGARVVDAATLVDAAAREEADALVMRSSLSSRPLTPRPLSHEGRGGGAVGVRVADCVPILVGSSAGVAAIHAGWKGLVAGVIEAALDALDAPGDAVAAIGPCIGPCCFEVGGDVAIRIAHRCNSLRAVHAGEGKPRVDLRLAARIVLEQRGVRDVEDVPGCTRCDAARFFSYRRDGERSGRHLAAIALPE